MNSLTTSRPPARPNAQLQHTEDLGAPGLLVVTLILMIFIVAAISVLAVTGAAWALWLAVLVLLLTSGALMASIAAMLNEPDEGAPVPEPRDEPRTERSHGERTRPARRRAPRAHPVANGGH